MSAQPAPKLYVVPSGPEVVFDVDEAAPLIPDAVYMGLCIGCDVKQVFGALKVALRFRITEGDHTGTVVPAWFRVGGKLQRGKGPRVKLHRRGRLFLMLCRLLGLARNTKTHHVSARELIGKLCRIETRTVSLDNKQKPLHLYEQYSVVKEVLEIEAG